MLAACKAALSGLSGPSSSGYRNAPSSPSDKQTEAFARAIAEGATDQVTAYVADSRALLVCSLKTHPARSTAWHLASAARGGRNNGAGSGAEMLELLLGLHSLHEFPAEGLADVLNQANKRGQTCLHVAASHGNTAAVRVLLGRGCGVVRSDKAGRTAMHWAAQAGSEECVRLLLEAAEAEDAAAGEAATAGTGTGGAVPAAAGERASPSAPSPRYASASSPSSPNLGLTTAVARLAGSSDSCGLTPLHFASSANALGVARLLLAAGASYTAQASADNFEASMPCNAGWTCLHVAAMRGHLDFAMTVLRYHLSLPAEEQLADWNPNRSSRKTSDPRAVMDRRGTTAAALAGARAFHDLAALLDPESPLAHSVAGSAPLGPDGRELRLPAMFLCPITQEVMRDPAVASDGFTYERVAIAKWISAGKLTSPMTNLPFSSRALYPNNLVLTAIKEWRVENNLPDPTVARRQARRLVGSGVVVDINNAVGRGNGGGGGGGGGGGSGGNDGSGDPFLSHLRAHGL